MSLRALVRRPSPHLAQGLVTHADRRDVDVEVALRQWEGYVQALRHAGWSAIEVERADDCPDTVFAEGTVVMYGRLAVITRPGVPERRAETAGTEAAARAAGIPHRPHRGAGDARRW